MSGLVSEAGSRDVKETRFVPIFVDRFFAGLYTNRNPLRSPFGALITAFYRIAGLDALTDGENVELSNRLTLIRRPGNTAGLGSYVPSASFPDVVDSFYSFHEITGAVRIIADGSSNGPYLAASSAWVPLFTKSAGAGQTYFQGVAQALYMTTLLDQQKWLDFGAGHPGNSFSTITATALTSGIASITAQNNFVAGQTAVISGTTNGSGAFNGTWRIISANPNTFTFLLAHANIILAADTGFASATWNLGVAGPSAPPSVTSVASGAAAVVWQASTFYSTMGLLVDANGNIQQLTSVSASGTNTTQLGKTGSGQPAWNQTLGGITTDNTVTWTNWGPIGLWASGRTVTAGNVIFVPNVGAGPTYLTLAGNGQGVTFPNTTPLGGLYMADLNDSGFSSGLNSVTGLIAPRWTNTINSYALDGSSGHYPIRWQYLGPVEQWKPSRTYHSWWAHYPQIVCEPALPNLSLLQAGTQIIYAQTSNDATSHSSDTPGVSGSGYSPAWATGVGQTTYDNDLIWVCLGPQNWQPNTPYYAWSNTTPTFSALVDGNGNFEVCVAGGTSGATAPFNGWRPSFSYALNAEIIVQSSAGNVIMKVTTAGTSGSTEPATWNFTLGNTTADGATLVWTSQGATTATKWSQSYGGQTQDGPSVKWVNVGSAATSTWATNLQWYYPVGGFIPPTAANPYGNTEVMGSAYVQAATVSGLSGASAPSWPTTVGSTVGDNQITWYTVAAFSQNSLAFTKGYGYAFSYKARTASDPYSPVSSGGSGVSFGLPSTSASGASNLGVAPAAAPTGSADGSVSSASPTFQLSGSSQGSVLVVSGAGSPDPQVDTVSIFRTTDGGGVYFWLTDIPNPPVVNGNPGTWTFNDFLPDFANSALNGLNLLVQAPLANFNNPPVTGMVNLVQFFGRLWGSVGATVYASNGPLVGGANQPPGNPYTAWNPAQTWVFPSPVTKLVPTNTGLLVFTTSDLFVIAGGPLITTMFPQVLLPGLGLSSSNALAVEGGLIYLFTADRQAVVLDPNMGTNEIGFPLGDILLNFNPTEVYLAHHIQGSNDKALFLADGSTGWYRCNATQAPDAQITGGTVWSPKANIVGGCGAIASLEVAPGTHALLLGAPAANHPILVRDSTFQTFSDNGTAYPAYATIGNVVLAQPGQLAEIGFITCDFMKTGSSPKVAVLFDEINPFVGTISAASQSGGNTTYTYSQGTPSVSPAVGMTATVANMADSGNNGTFVIASVGVGAFTVANANGVTRTGQTGAVTTFEDLSGYIMPATGIPPQDPPSLYGATLTPFSVFANRYWLAQSINGTDPLGVFCRHLQIRVDYGATDTVQNEILSLCIFGAHWGEQ